jgi:hypothetical protein
MVSPVWLRTTPPFMQTKLPFMVAFSRDSTMLLSMVTDPSIEFLGQEPSGERPMKMPNRFALVVVTPP